MARRNRTPADAGALAASLLVASYGMDPADSLGREVVRDLALDLERRLDNLSRSDGGDPDALGEAALACADLATLAACNLPEFPHDAEALAAAAVHLAAGAAHALVVLVEARAETLDEDHAENTLKDARSALWRADLAVRQIETLRKDEAPD